MQTWPKIYVPPATDGINHKPLALYDSYKKVRIGLDNPIVSSYVCGITPYDATHLGHAATYITFDLIHRYLLARGQQLHFVENITDIDDPLLERANRDDQDWRDLAHSQIALFTTDMTALHVVPPSLYLGVVESMPVIIEFITDCINRKLTYKLDEDIYLELNQLDGFPDSLPISEPEALRIFKERGGDPERSGKKHPLDPLLWKSYRQGEPFWSSPFGDGRPGWHVECTAIALHSLPKSEATSISLQGGGSDLFFPHHYMTALQAKAVTGFEFAQCYVHAGMIGLDGEKMSKSKGNLIFVSKLLQQGVQPAVIRLALIMEHYQTDRMWSDDQLSKATKLFLRIQSVLSRNEVAPTTVVIQKMVDSLAANLDTPSALRHIEKWCTDSEAGQSGGSTGELSRALDTYLGILL